MIPIAVNFSSEGREDLPGCPARKGKALSSCGDSILWSWREELNLQPAVYKTAALPLSYASLHETSADGLCATRWKT